MPNVCQIIDSFLSGKFLSIVLKNPGTSSSTDICGYLCHKGRISEIEVRYIFIQCIRVIKSLENSAILHGDINPQNIIINYSNTRITFVDFGCASKFTTDPYYTYDGAMPFSPPEWIEHKCFHADGLNVWSLGVLLAFLLLGRIPFQNNFEIQLANMNWLNRRGDHSLDLARFVRWALTREPNKRPSLRDLLNHPWLNLEVLPTV